MSTRGFITFVIDGVEKTAYNHHDSYPSGVGLDVLSWIQGNLHSLTCDIHRGESGGPVRLAQKLRVVPPDSEPTDEDIERLKGSWDPSVGERRDRPDWYQLLRHNQGNPAAMLAAGVIEDSSDFPTDSLYAEYGYVIDLDEQVFEVYRGFQKVRHSAGRFADRRGSDDSTGYFPCARVQHWTFSALPTEDEFVAACEESDR
jgi:hypothetical protein